MWQLKGERRRAVFIPLSDVERGEGDGRKFITKIKSNASQTRQKIFDYPIEVRLGESDASSISESINQQDILVNTVLL